MKTTLYIDTSEMKTTRVVLEQGDRRVEKTVSSDTWRSQAVLPLIRQLLDEQNIPLSDLNAISVHPGPGSFTGLRVGYSIAQMLAALLEIPVKTRYDNFIWTHG